MPDGQPSKSDDHSLMNDFDDAANYDDDDILPFIMTNVTTPSFARIHNESELSSDPKALIPGPPRDVVAQIINPRFVSLSWMEPLKNPDEVTSYSIFYKMNTSER